MAGDKETGLKLDDVLGRRTLIVGEVNIGKTSLTRALLAELVEAGPKGRVVVLDLAPDVPAWLAAGRGLKGVGGRLRPAEDWGVVYLRTPLLPPRLGSRSETQAQEAARANLRAIQGLLEGFRPLPDDAVFINDVSLFVQAGRAEDLLAWLGPARTVVANGYLGSSLGGGRLSAHERNEMEKLMAFFDRVIKVGGGEGG